MSSSLTVVLLIVAIGIGALLALVRHSKAANPPGLVANQLQICPQSSNCVCSENGGSDESKIDPFTVLNPKENTYDASRPINWEQLTGVLIADGAIIVSQSETYLAATYASKFFGFVDDLELRLDTQSGLIHVRSASRTGKSDFGINRSRIERLRKKIDAARIRS